MRPNTSRTLSHRDVQAFARDRLAAPLQLPDHGPKCTAPVVLAVLLRAAARTSSIHAACADLAGAPCDQAVRDALAAGLPRRLTDLERRLDAALTPPLTRPLRRRAWHVACDLHLVPYHGAPARRANELYHCKARSGTTKSHAYATACIVCRGARYTLALTAVKGREPMTVVLKRLLDRVAARGVRVKALLLDRQFSTKDVVAALRERGTPFLMPAKLSGRVSKDPGRAPRGLRAFLDRPPGRYPFTWDSRHGPLRFTVVVAHQRYTHRKTRRRGRRVLLYLAWRVGGGPEQVREHYRRRFGIESSYRQLGQARARTCTRDPRLRLLLVAVALVLRNVWVWLHATCFTDRQGPELVAHPERLRFRRLLDWIAQAVTEDLHDGSAFRVEVPS